MKTLAVAFSARSEGNCARLSRYCLDKLKEQGWQTELLNAYDLAITPCSHCDYECFANKDCPVNDDVPMIYEKCREADALIFAIPDYGGHLSALYFTFAQRGQFEFKKFNNFDEEFFRKLNFIIIGNLSAGGDMALHEALYDFANRSFWPETILFSAREYDRSSLEGDLIESPDVKKRLDRFVEMVVEESRTR